MSPIYGGPLTVLSQSGACDDDEAIRCWRLSRLKGQADSSSSIPLQPASAICTCICGSALQSLAAAGGALVNARLTRAACRCCFPPAACLALTSRPSPI
mmetsp:Transcript_932/g.2082  ORF Transcript_932/g.2082 Transcript_932/m.2082 type:complete len:99 (+) Transcript_932:339-635(+)